MQRTSSRPLNKHMNFVRKTLTGTLQDSDYLGPLEMTKTVHRSGIMSTAER